MKQLKICKYLFKIEVLKDKTMIKIQNKKIWNQIVLPGQFKVDFNFFGYFYDLLIFNTSRGFYIIDYKKLSLEYLIEKNDNIIKNQNQIFRWRRDRQYLFIYFKGKRIKFLLADLGGLYINSEYKYIRIEHILKHQFQLLNLRQNEIRKYDKVKVIKRKNSIEISPLNFNKTVIFLKGGPFSYLSGGYSYFINKLIQLKMRIIVLDYPGDLHLKNRGIKLNNFQFKIFSNIEQLKIKKDSGTYLIAHSFGCSLISHLASRFQFDKIISINGYIDGYQLKQLLPKELCPKLENYTTNQTILHFQSMFDPIISYRRILNYKKRVKGINVIPLSIVDHEINSSIFNVVAPYLTD